MAQNFDSALDALIYFTNELNSKTKSTIFDIADAQKKFQAVLREFPVQEVRELKTALGNLSGEMKSVVDDVVNENDKYIKELRNREENEKAAEEKRKAKEEEEAELDAKRREEKRKAYQEEIDIIEAYIANLNKQLNDSKLNAKTREDFENQLKAYEQQKAELEAEQTGNTEDRVTLLTKKQSEDLQRKRELDEKYLAEERKKKLEEQIKNIGDFVGNAFREVSNKIKSAADTIVNVYEKSAGSMAAALDSSVSDISNLQRKIANELRSTDLKSAISSVAVMSEAASLTSAGYTNESKLQATATGLAIGRELAPNISFDTSTVKTLTNVFGSDFISKFSAIQLAVQDTAGSTISINANLNQMMSDLEPVYLNAEYSNQALQDTSDIQATLSAAMDAGIISEKQSKEYVSMIAELMDPNKAFKSSSTAVRAAATTYDFGSGSPLQALQAILNARQQMYGSIDSSNSYMGNVSRSLAASAYGDDTMSATYMQSGLYGLNVLNTEDLGTVYETGLSNLQSGRYTTRKEQEDNRFANSATAQGIARINENFPIMFSAFSGKLFTQLATLPQKIAAAIKIGLPIGGGEGGTGGITDATGTLTTTAGGSGGLSSRFSSSAFFNAGFLGKEGSRLSRLTSGFTTGAASLGVVGLSSLLGQWDKERGWGENLGFGGDYTQSALSYAGMGLGAGAMIGSFFPGAGNVIGAGIGALVGAIGGLIAASVAQNEATKENTKKLEAQTQAYKDTLGEGVTAIDTLEAKRTIARGGGIVYSSEGQAFKLASYTNGYASGLDFVPYDGYVAKLHRGESVVSASAAEQLRKRDPNFWNDAYNNNVVNAIEKQTDSIVNAVNGEIKYSPLTTVGPKQYTIKNSNAF